MSRIHMSMTLKDMLVAMSDGNGGAIDAMTALAEAGPHIDPNNPIADIAAILLLDTYRIYGSDIYLLYNDVCRRDVVQCCAIIYALQLGFVGLAEVRQAMSGWGFGQSVAENDARKKGLIAAVKERVPGFGIAAAAQPTEAFHG